jgi:molybdopterin-guanine dinucleotide biosynthesis protein A
MVAFETVPIGGTLIPASGCGLPWENALMDRRTVAAVLAGGSSSRFGSPKADLEIAGKTFLERIVEMLLDGFDTVYVCGGDAEVLGSTLIHDARPHAGPLGGIVSALDRAQDRPVFITAVDMPLLTMETVDRLTTPVAVMGHARIARVDGRPQPLCGSYGGDLASLADRHFRYGDRSVMGLVTAVPHLELVDITDGSLRNINTPEDYESLLADLS